MALRVAPLVGAWIETGAKLSDTMVAKVAPLVGAWIETRLLSSNVCLRGVAPLVGAWIETYRQLSLMSRQESRSPRGSVD